MNKKVGMNENELSKKFSKIQKVARKLATLLKIHQRTNHETYDILAFLYCYRAH